MRIWAIVLLDLGDLLSSAAIPSPPPDGYKFHSQKKDHNRLVMGTFRNQEKKKKMKSFKIQSS